MIPHSLAEAFWFVVGGFLFGLGFQLAARILR